MDTLRRTEIPLELFEQLFPWPGDVPLPRPWFGNVTRRVSDRLRGPVNRFDDLGSQPPFRVVWESDDLGLKVHVEEEVGEHVGQLSVTVLCNRPEHLNKQAKVVLVGKPGDEGEHQLLMSVDLDIVRLDPLNPDPQKPVGCSGWSLLGSPEDLRSRLGDGDIVLDAFLLV